MVYRKFYKFEKIIEEYPRKKKHFVNILQYGNYSCAYGTKKSNVLTTKNSSRQKRRKATCLQLVTQCQLSSQHITPRPTIWKRRFQCLWQCEAVYT